MIVRTTAAGVWLAVICSMAAPSAALCEVRTLSSAESSSATVLPPPVISDDAFTFGEASSVAPRQEALSAQPEADRQSAGSAAGADLRALDTITAPPPQSIWRRLLSAIVQLGGANR